MKSLVFLLALSFVVSSAHATLRDEFDRRLQDTNAAEAAARSTRLENDSLKYSRFEAERVANAKVVGEAEITASQPQRGHITYQMSNGKICSVVVRLTEAGQLTGIFPWTTACY